MKTRHFLASVVGIVAAGLTGVSTALAADFPDKPIRIVVPYPPGGASDIFARLLSQKLGETFKQTVIVDNKPGAGGTLGADLVAKSRPDGLTLLLSDVSVYSIAPSLYPKLPYKAADLAPVINVGTSPQLLITAASSQQASLRDVLASEKEKPGQLNIASSGNGTGTHLSAELLNTMSGAKLRHIPYKGGGAALNDVVSGQVHMMFIGTPPAMPLVASGKLRVLAVTTPARIPALPQVPSVSELVPGFEAVAGQGLFAPAGTPPEIVARIHLEVERVLAQPDVRKRWAELGAEPVRNTPQQFKAWLDAEAVKWRKVIQDAGVKPD